MFYTVNLCRLYSTAYRSFEVAKGTAEDSGIIAVLVASKMPEESGLLRYVTTQCSFKQKAKQNVEYVVTAVLESGRPALRV